MLNKKEINFGLSIVQKGIRKKKKSVLSDLFSNRWSVGTYKSGKNEYVYTYDDIKVIESLFLRSGIDSSKEIIFGGSRTETAKHIVNEKLGASSVFPNPICMKVLENGVLINGRPVHNTGVGHIQFNYQDIENIDARGIVLVENLDTIRLLDNIIFDMDTRGLLFVWRGGPFSRLSMPNTQKAVIKLCQDNKLAIGYFGDYDLKGLIIGMELKGEFVILPKLIELREKNVKGSEIDYAKQLDEYNAKKDSINAVEAFTSHASYLLAIKKSFTQERMCALDVTHEFVVVIQNAK